MQIYPNLPPLTIEEARRCRLKPRQLLNVAALDDRDPQARKTLDHMTNRYSLLPSEESGTGKTSAKLYSLEACVMARVIVEEAGRERTLRTAAIIARAVADLLPEALAFPTLDDFRFAEEPDAPWRILLVDIPFGANPVKTHVVTAAEFTPENILARDWWGMSAVFPHHLLLRTIETFGEVWADEISREAKTRKRAAPLQSDPPPKVCA